VNRSDALPIGVIAFRPLALKDLPLLHEWLERPHVAEWWTPTPSLAEIVQEFGPLISHQSTTRAYLVLGDEEPIGYIQSYIAKDSGDEWWPDEEDAGVWGIDQFLAMPAKWVAA